MAHPSDRTPQRPRFIYVTGRAEQSADGRITVLRVPHAEPLPDRRNGFPTTGRPPAAAQLPLTPATRLLLDAFSPVSDVPDASEDIPMRSGASQASAAAHSAAATRSTSASRSSAAAGARKAETPAVLTPTIHIRPGLVRQLDVSFQFGPPDTPYVLKDLAGFLRAMRRGTPLVLGRRFTFTPGSSRLAPGSAALARFLTDTLADLESYFGDLNQFQLATRSRDAKRVPLTRSGTDRLLGILERGADEADGNTLMNAQAGSLHGRRAFPGMPTGSRQDAPAPLPVHIEWEPGMTETVTVRSDDWRMPLLVESIPGGFALSPDLDDLASLGVLDADHRLLVHGGILHRLSGEEATRMRTFLPALNRTDDLRLLVPEGEASRLFGMVLPAFGDEERFRMTGDIAAKLEREPLVRRVYLDTDVEGLLAWPEYRYGDRTVDPANAREALYTADGRLILRDLAGEAVLPAFLTSCGFMPTASGYRLSDEDNIVDFLTDGFPQLFDLAEVHATTAFSGRQVRRHVKVHASLSLTGNELLSLSVKPEGVKPADLLRMLAGFREKRRFVRLADESCVRLAGTGVESLAELIDALECRDPDLADPVIELPRYRALYLENLARDTGLALTRSPEVRAMVRDITAPGDLTFGEPAGLTATLRDYQKTGVNWLETLARFGMGGILADDMGLGKTLQVLTLLLREKERRAAEGLPAMPSLVVAPTSLVYNWQAEAERFAPGLETLVIAGGAELRDRQRDAVASADLVITSYALIRRDMEEYGHTRFRFCIADEAQHVKNPLSVGARALRAVKADIRFALTGTPIENNLTELWALFDFVLPGYLHSHRRFQVKYETPVVRQRDTGALQELTRHIRPFILRRLKQDVLTELPEKLETRILCSMSVAQGDLYAAHMLHAKQEVETTLQKAGIDRSRIRILALLTRLRQVCCHPGMFLDGYRGGSGKLDALLEVVADARESGHRMLVFSQFTTMLGLIRQALEKEKVHCLYLDGDTPAQERHRLVRDFNAGTGEVFLISLKAGGAGLNLTGADTVIHFDPWWNPAVEEQATDRAYRMGQKNTVQVIRLVAANTIEEKIAALQLCKKGLIDQAIQPGETFLTQLEPQEVLSLFA